MNNLITAVNKDMPLPPNGSTNLAGTKSILWEKIAVEPSQIAMKYDVSGNLTNDGVRSYYWNGEGMLVRVQGSGFRADYGYDGMSRKVRSRDYVYTNSSWTLTRDIAYVYDGWNPVADVAVSPTVTVSKSYVWGLDLSGSLQGAGGVGGLLSATCHLSPVTCHFFLYDGNGNIVGTINCADGAISSRYEYDPFGRLVCKEGSYADENEYRFSTKRYNAAWSLYDYGYRHYSPDLGRWISRDPMGEDGGVNPYSFLSNCSLWLVDYLGMAPTIPVSVTYDPVTGSSTMTAREDRTRPPKTPKIPKTYCCYDKTYDRGTECCCKKGVLGGTVVESDRSSDCSTVNKTEISSGIKSHYYATSFQPSSPLQSHAWLSWKGYSSDNTVECNAPSGMPGLVRRVPQVMQIDGVPPEETKLSPCSFDFTKFHKCLTDESEKDIGKTSGMGCGNYIARLIEKCRDDSKTTGCTP